MEKVTFEITRKQLESILDTNVTDAQWETLKGEVIGVCEYYVEEDLPRIFSEMP